MAIDPVCGMTVDEQTAIRAERDGETFYFCCEHCRRKFLQPDQRTTSQPQLHQLTTLQPVTASKPASCCSGAHPADRHSHQYQKTQPSGQLGKAFFCPMCEGVESDTPGTCPKCGMALEPAHPPQRQQKTVYTCPMHPEVEQDHPGNCPKCGMALEPKQVTSSTPERDPELDDMQRRFWLSLPLTAAVFLLSMAPMVGIPVDRWIGHSASLWLQGILSTPVVLWGGWPFFQRGYRSLISRHFNMFTLIALGTGAAYGYSVLALLFPAAIPQEFRDHGMVHVYFEAAAVIVTLVLLGQVLELRARRRTGDAIRELMNLAPATARIVRDGKEVEIPLEQVQVGDVLRVKPGEKIPVDGHVTEGRSTVDESLVTGESLPVQKSPSDPVIAGSVNQHGSFLMAADKVGGDTLLARIVTMVSEAQRSRAPIQKVADRVAQYFVPAVLLAAVLTAVVWAVAAPAEPRLAYAFVNAIAVLIIACPCALGLATPMSIMVGVGRGAKEGVLIRNAEALEALEQVDTLVIDKTGTLTEGRPRLTECLPVGDFTSNDVLKFAACVEQQSEHPLARPIVDAAGAQGLTLDSPRDFQSVTGEGVTGTVHGRRVMVGKRSFLQNQQVDFDNSASERASNLQQSGQTVMFVGIDGLPAGLIAVSDPIKKSTPGAIRALHDLGLKVIMLTGDNQQTAASVAKTLGIDDFQAEVRPEEKHARIQSLKQDGAKVAMAGDGINDAPALAAADVGIAMGTGTDVAIESADVTLVKGDLNGIVKAISLSRRTLRNIRQNLFFAFIYNILGVPVAAGILYPLSSDLLMNPMLAAAAMSFSSVSVIANALRLKTIALK